MCDLWVSLKDLLKLCNYETIRHNSHLSVFRITSICCQIVPMKIIIHSFSQLSQRSLWNGPATSLTSLLMRSLCHLSTCSRKSLSRWFFFIHGGILYISATEVFWHSGALQIWLLLLLLLFPQFLVSLGNFFIFPHFQGSESPWNQDRSLKSLNFIFEVFESSWNLGFWKCVN